jgi:hypothetical protein
MRECHVRVVALRASGVRSTRAHPSVRVEYLWVLAPHLRIVVRGYQRCKDHGTFRDQLTRENNVSSRDTDSHRYRTVESQDFVSHSMKIWHLFDLLSGDLRIGVANVWKI